jgi:hypothetical protein
VTSTSCNFYSDYENRKCICLEFIRKKERRNFSLFNGIFKSFVTGKDRKFYINENERIYADEQVGVSHVSQRKRVCIVCAIVKSQKGGSCLLEW